MIVESFSCEPLPNKESNKAITIEPQVINETNYFKVMYTNKYSIPVTALVPAEKLQEFLLNISNELG